MKNMDFKTSLFITILKVVALISLTTCYPTSSSYNPCSTFYNEDDTDVTLFCDEPNTSLEQIKTALKEVRGQGTIELELYQVNLGTVPSDFFKGHNIKILTIAFCELDSLSGGGGWPLEGLEDSLEVLMIKGSLKNENAFEMSLLGHLKRLKELQLQSNSFREVGNDWFESTPPLLRTIILSENDIEKLGDRVFEKVLHLEYLFVNDNKFGSVTRSMLPIPSVIKRIELENNGLDGIPEDFFTKMPNLKQVSLASNNIKTLPEKVWLPVWKQLENLDVTGNPIECDNHLDWISRHPACVKVSATCESSNSKFPSFISDEYCS